MYFCYVAVAREIVIELELYITAKDCELAKKRVERELSKQALFVLLENSLGIKATSPRSYLRNFSSKE